MMRLRVAVAVLLAVSLACGVAAAGQRGQGGGRAEAGRGGGDKCRALLGKWRQIGENKNMMKVMHKQDKIEKKMAKHGCPAPSP